MKRERDIICSLIAPFLETYALYGEHVRIIDLRWGIDTTDLATDKATAKILNKCLEYARESPMFIGFVGHQYGTSIKISTLERILDKAALEDIKIGAKYIFGRCPENLSLTMLEVLSRLGAEIRTGGDFSNILIYIRTNEEKATNEEEWKRLIVHQYRSGICNTTAYKTSYYDSKKIPTNFHWNTASELEIAKTALSFLDRCLEKQQIKFFSMSPDEQDCTLISNFIDSICSSSISVETWMNYPQETKKRLSDNNMHCGILAGQHGMGTTELLCRIINTYRATGSQTIAVLPDPLHKPLDEKRLLELILHQLNILVGRDARRNSNNLETYYQAIEESLQQHRSTPNHPLVLFADIANIPNYSQITEKLSNAFSKTENTVLITTAPIPISSSFIKSDKAVFYVPALDIPSLSSITKKEISFSGKEVSAEVSELYWKKSNIARHEKTPLYHSLLGKAHIQLASSIDSAKFRDQNKINEWLTNTITKLPESTEAIVIELAKQNDRFIGIGKLTEYLLYFIAASHDGVNTNVLAELVNITRKQFESDDTPIQSAEIVFYLAPILTLFSIEGSSLATYRLKRSWLKQKITRTIENSDELRKIYIDYLLRFDSSNQFVVDNLASLAYKACDSRVLFRLMVEATRKNIPLEPITSRLHDLTKSDDGDIMAKICSCSEVDTESRSALSYLLWFTRSIKTSNITKSRESARLRNIGKATLQLFEQYQAKSVDIQYLSESFRKTKQHLAKNLAFSDPMYVIEFANSLGEECLILNETASAADVFHSLGDAYTQIEDIKNATRNYQKAIKIRECEKESIGEKPFDYLDTGYAYWQSKKYDEAIREYSLAIHLLSESAPLSKHETWLLGHCHYMMARCRRKAGDTEPYSPENLSHCRQAIQLISKSMQESLPPEEIKVRMEQESWCEWALVTHYAKTVELDNFMHYFDLAFNNWCSLMSSATNRNDITSADQAIESLFDGLNRLTMSLSEASAQNKLFSFRRQYYDRWRDLEDQVFNGRSNISTARSRSNPRNQALPHS